MRAVPDAGNEPVTENRVERSIVTRATATEGDPRTDRPGSASPSRRELFALAAVLAATALTAGAAIAGLTRTAPAAPSVPVVSQIVQPAPAAPRRVEPGD